MKFERIDGVLDLDQYAALGDGRSVALVGLDGSIDWWCVPNLDSPPLFDQILRDDNPAAGRFQFTRMDRLDLTRIAIQRELGHGPLVYGYSGAAAEERAFLACSFWLVEAFAFLGHAAEARRSMDELLARVETRNLGFLNEMADPVTGKLVGNLPQGLSHLALIHAALAVNDAERGTIGR